MTVLRAMGVGEPETFRCRVYNEQPTTEELHRKHREFIIEQAATERGFIEAPAFDAALAELVAEGVINPTREIVHVDGIGLEPHQKVAVWRLA